MINAAGTDAATDTANDPAASPRDRDGRLVPIGIANALVVVRILLAYGRHLATILPVAAAWPAFAAIARFFPKAAASETHARIHRGILRALALERVLLDRARRDRDLKVLSRSARRRAEAAPASLPERPEPAAPRRRRRADDRHGIWLDRLPTLAEMETQVRRRPIGRTIGDICLDLGVSAKLCAPWFWTGLFNTISAYRGNIGGVCVELHQREERFLRDYTGPHDVLQQMEDDVGQVVKFRIGEKPVDPCPPASPIYPVLAHGVGPPRFLGWT